ncbi:histidine kinase [Micromonospora sp. NPDC007271]|uniref:sensor histidine kinase n=1 Tax=Micromonospora sp. NPDC007271 TaxID=3154587 RepID=UPI00340C24DE
MTVPRLVAYAMAVVSVVLVAVGGWLLALGADGGHIVYFVSACLLAAASVALGMLIVTKRPANVIGALLTLFGLLAIWVALTDVYAYLVAHRPGRLPVSSLLATVGQGSWMLNYLPAALLMLLFPDGRLLPGRRWRVVAAGLVLVPAAFIVLTGLDPAPFPPPFADAEHAFGTPPPPVARVLEPIAVALLPGLLALLVASAVAMVVRYRRATDPVRRAQLKWFALGAFFLPATLLLCWLSYLLLDGPDLVVIGLAATLIAIPTATTIGILRHDLYDVDKALSATVTYGLVTAALLAFYTAAMLVAGLAAGRSSPVAAAGATAVCALALSPLRVRLQRQVDRRCYPARRAALAAIDDLRARMHAGEAAPERLEEALQQALRDPQVRVGYRMPGTDELVTAGGASFVAADDATVIRLGGQQIGVLVRGETTTRELMRELAEACALLVEVVRLRLQLRRALLDVEASRARLLRAGYAERLRLERDLHDGAQQRLVSLGMALRLAQRRLPEADVAGVLDQAVAELGTAVAELREIAHGLRPSSLDEGLANALTMLVRGVPLSVTLDVCREPVPEDLATTAYYVASEALANVVKHSRASAVHLQVARTNGDLTVLVRDDGVGGARVRPGGGLAGLSDRVAAAGGSLTVAGGAGDGTRVEAVLPCGS